MNIPRLIIAAPMSGSGKTTIAAGLMAAFTQRGLRVAPFKVGPDYIDPSYHALAAGRASHNLDPWLLKPEQITMSFARRVQDADIAILEGVMGLFDGYSGRDDTGSTAHIARLLNTPVLLVLDAKAMSRSAAAIVRGFCDFDSRVNLVGVILNRIGSPTHAAMVKEAIETETRVPVVGYLTRDSDIQLPERHLGLIPTAEPGRWQDWVERIRSKLETTVNLERVLDLAQAASPLPDPVADSFAPRPTLTQPIIAVARDAAFNFIYEDNLDLLRAAGAKIEFFSPLEDRQLPTNTQGLYLCGGFPELFAEQLSRNTTLYDSIRAAHKADLPIYAECGGLMYLTEAICDLNNATHPMVGLLPGVSTMTPKLTLGYRQIQALDTTWLWQAGETLRGHEFHHSVWQSRPEHLPYLYELQPDALVSQTRQEGVHQQNLIASYTHLHFLAKPELTTRFVLAGQAFNLT